MRLIAPGLDTHNAACGIETITRRRENVDFMLVSTHTMLRAALKHRSYTQRETKYTCLDTHNAACGIETADTAYNLRSLLPVSTHTMLRAALKHLLGTKSLRQQFVSTHTMLRAALKPQRMWIMPSKFLCLDTHNAACGIETKHKDVQSGR